MADNIQFYVDDTSPSITYFPFGDTFSVPNLTAGWNPYFDESGFASALGETGKGISYHVTSCDGASIIVQWKGTGIQLFGQPTQATYTITLDGIPTQSFSVDLENNVLANFTNLTDTSHTIVLTTQIFQNQSEFFFDKALIIGSHDAIANTSVAQRALNDNDVAYSGQWSFQSVSGSSFHHSTTIGDRAEARFRGILFLLNGTTSPTSGDYTVILDNVATSFSAKSSFTTEDALLFYAGDLDPNATHTIQIINNGGDLSLDVGGFTVFLTEPAISETPSSTPSPSSLATPPGTIAALVLAGVLLFLILTASLLWVFVVRPRRRRHRLVGPEQSKKEAEAGIVLDIGPEIRPSVESRRDETNPPQRNSEKSGFVRWKRDMEGGLGSLIGITFRHSGSSRGKVTSRHVVDEVKSSLLSLSSKSSLRRGKGKAKKGPKGRHANESATIGLPARPSSTDSSKDKDISPYQDPPEGPHSIVSTLTSLSYASSPSPFQNPQPAPPPSYSVSNSNGNSHSTSEPHSASHSFPSATRQGGRRSSRTRDESAPGSRDDVLLHDRHDLSQVPDTHHPSRLQVTGGDRDSAKDSSDDAASFVTQFALRGLSPRTSEYVEPTLVKPKPAGDKPPATEPRVRPRPLPDPPQSRAGQSDNPDLQDSPEDILPESLEERRQTVTRPFDDPLLNPIPSSPFRVDFPTARPLKQSRESGPPVPFVRFDGGSREELTVAGGESDSSKREAGHSQDPQAKRRSIFRLTPPSGPSQTVSACRPRVDSTSFLDLTSSSDSSTRTQSLMTPDEQESSRQWATLPLPRLQTRWSTSATDLSINASFGAPRSAFSGNFPYPVSVAASPEGHIPPESIAIPTLQIPQHIHPATDSPMIHPFFPSSPADSVPISVSEIQFRRSSTSSNSTNSPIPPHPPLPSRETGPESGDLVTSALSTPSLIVQRVLGQTTTTPPTG